MRKTNPRRGSELIAKFVDGFAENWFMPVKECFKHELGIKYTQRVKNKIVSYELTQGNYYCFSAGQVIYDNVRAYDDWSRAIKAINYACQIIEAKPDTPPETGNLESLNNTNKTNGFVKFVLYKKNTDTKQLTAFICYNVSQNDFVEFLMNGAIGNDNYKIQHNFVQQQLL
jgi:hypothetical protein